MDIRYAQHGLIARSAPALAYGGAPAITAPPRAREQHAPLPANASARAPHAANEGVGAAAVAPQYFRTVENIHARMRELEAAHPDLVKVINLGRTPAENGGRELLAMRVTAGVNAPAAADKPAAVMLGGVHAREIANPEMLMGWVEQLAKGYGSDATATALLDERRLVVMPVVNPDGHAIVERGYADGGARDLLWHRTNGRPGGGVDLNRNFPFHWGEVGSSPRPGAENYRGPAAGSEAETQAMMKLIADEKPGMVLDWHSHGEFVLAPYGHNEVPKDDAGMRDIGAAFNRRNGYKVMTSWEFGSGSGTSKDWAYGVQGVPAFTVETGHDFHQSDASFADTVKRNRPVLEQALYMVDAPYVRSLGPDAALGAGGLVDLKAVPRRRGKESPAVNAPQITVAGAELVSDLRGTPGSGRALQAKDGSFDSPAEPVLLPADAFQNATRGYVLVRGRDSAGVWGNPVAIARPTDGAS